MSRNVPKISCGPEDRQALERLAVSRTESKQMVERARIILRCLAGKLVKDVAAACQTRPNTVIKWRQRFAQRGLAGLHDAARPGAKPVYGVDFRNRVVNDNYTYPSATITFTHRLSIYLAWYMKGIGSPPTALGWAKNF